MKTKHLIASAMALSLVAGFAFTLPAFADTDANVSVGVNAPGVNVNAGADAQEHGDWQGRPGMMGPRGMMGKPAVVGTVSTVSGTTLTVSGRNGFMPGREGSSTPTTIFTVDASNATFMKGGATSTVSAISAGDVVVIQGTVSGTNITATMIRDGQMPRPQKNGEGNDDKSNVMAQLQGNGEPVIAGTISAINGSSLTVTNKSNVTYTVDATSAKILLGQTAGSLTSVKVGDSIVVQGTVNGTSVTASTVIDQNASANAGGGIKGFFGGIKNFFSHLFGF